MKLMFCTFLLALTAQASTYNYTTLQYPGAIGTYPVSANKAGVVAGYYFDSSYTGHGFTYANGTYAAVNAGGTCYESFVTGINDAGVLAGYCFSTKGGTVDFIDINGIFTFYGANLFDSYAQRINNANTSVGWYFTNANTIASFYAVNGKLTRTFVAPNASNATFVYGENNHGTLVENGTPNNLGSQQGFIEKKNVYTFYQYPGAYDTFFNGVNDSTLVVGDESKAARGAVTAFVFQNGTFTDLSVPSATASVATGVNNSGMIVGYYVTGSQSLSTNATGFIATPQN